MDVSRRDIPDACPCEGSFCRYRYELVRRRMAFSLPRFDRTIYVDRLFNFALAFAVPPGLSSIAYNTYFIFGAFNFAAFIHIFFCFPETAGRTLEEVEEVFSKGHKFTAWKIGWEVGKKTLDDLTYEDNGKATVSLCHS